MTPDPDELLRGAGRAGRGGPRGRPTGFGPARSVARQGLSCQVAALCRLPRFSGDRIKTDSVTPGIRPGCCTWTRSSRSRCPPARAGAWRSASPPTPCSPPSPAGTATTPRSPRWPPPASSHPSWPRSGCLRGVLRGTASLTAPREPGRTGSGTASQPAPARALGPVRRPPQNSRSWPNRRARPEPSASRPTGRTSGSARAQPSHRPRRTAHPVTGTSRSGQLSADGGLRRHRSRRSRRRASRCRSVSAGGCHE